MHHDGYLSWLEALLFCMLVVVPLVGLLLALLFSA